jgi:acylaminoacyl-peptidase
MRGLKTNSTEICLQAYIPYNASQIGGFVRRLTIDDVIRIARITDVRLSQKGDLAIIDLVADVDKNKYVSEIRVLTSAGDEFYLVGEGDSLPRWSPSSNKLAFISRRGAGKDDKGSGIYVWGLRGEPRRVAWFRDGILDLEWLDDNTLVALSATPREGFYDPDGDYISTDRLPIWFDGRGFIGSLTGQLYLVDIDSGRVRRITDEENSIQGFSICGNAICYYTREEWRRPFPHVVKRITPGGSQDLILRGYAVSQLYSIDSELYMLGHRMSIGIASHYRLWRILDGDAHCLSCSLDRNIHMIAGDLDGKPVVVYPDQGRIVLSVIDSKGPRDLVRRNGVVITANARGGRAAYVYASPTQPPEVYVVENGSEKRITRINEWVSREAKLYEPIYEPVEINGRRIDGWVIIPEGGSRKPLILYIHGGPKGMYGYYFNPEMQLMASEGFIVAFCNPRGSDGYDEEFADIRGGYGERDYEEIMAFLDNIVRKYPVDEDRMAVTGISYGGYMTNVVITKTHRFRAAVSENGIADWIADYWASDIGYYFNPDQIGGTPIDNLEEYIRKSPAFHVASVKTPLLLIHSMEDYRCFIDQSLAMHTAMVMAGKDSRIVVFTKGSHGHSIAGEPRHRKKRYEIKISWLKEKLGIKDGERESRDTRHTIQGH